MPFEDPKNPETPPSSPEKKEEKKEDPLTKILEDPERSELFLEFLQKKKYKEKKYKECLEIISRTQMEKETETGKGVEIEFEELKKLNTAKKEFLEVLKEVDKVKGLLESFFDSIIENSDELKILKGVVGEKRIKSGISGQLEKLAINYPSDFEALKSKLDLLKTLQTQEWEIDDKIQKIKDEIEELSKGISLKEKEKIEKKIRKIVEREGETAEAKEIEIEKIIKENIGFLERLRKGGKGKLLKEVNKILEKIEKEEEKEEKLKKLEDVRKKLDDEIKEAGEALSFITMKVPEIKNKVVSLVKGPEKKISNFPEAIGAAKDVMESVSNILNKGEKEISQRFRNFLEEAELEEKEIGKPETEEKLIDGFLTNLIKEEIENVGVEKKVLNSGWFHFLINVMKEILKSTYREVLSKNVKEDRLRKILFAKKRKK